MDNTHASTTHHGHAEPSFSTSAIWRTFWILLIITCIELVIGMFVAPNFPSIKILFNVLYIFLTLIKAFYIVAEFMHLRYELKKSSYDDHCTAVFVYMVCGRFLWDGDSYKDLRNTYDPHKKEQKQVKVEKHDAGDAKHPGKLE